MGFIRKLLGGAAKPAGAADMALEKMDALLQAGEYLATCRPFGSVEFEAVDGILVKAGAAYGSEKRQQMLAAYQGSSGGNEKLRILLAEEVAGASHGVLQVLPSLSLTPDNKARVAKMLKRLQS